MGQGLTWQHVLGFGASALLFVVHLLVAARAITRPDRTPASRVAWVAVIMALPVVGIIAYLMLGETSIGRERVRALHRAEEELARPQHEDPATRPRGLDPRVTALFDLARRINGFPAVGGNQVELLGDPANPASQPMLDSEQALHTLIRDIEAATEQVHLSFYIWLDDHLGGAVVDAVCAAAERGVRCRVMVDALGSRAFTRSPRWRQLTEAGVATVATLDDIPRLGHLAIGRVDLRNHRKIAVIDNQIAYCGSQNCADPQFLPLRRYAPWVDVWFRCQGPVVRQEQDLFLTTWLAETSESIEDLAAAPVAPASLEPGVVAQMFGTGPTTHGNAMSDMFVATIYAAQHDLLITTPYFVPDEALVRAICAAPGRGVRTRIIFPARNNSWLVGASCRSRYPELLEAGVEIYEYPLGLLHTKSITLDGEVALVGSANMDRRSLELNFENNLLIADPGTTATIRRRQEGYLSVSRPVLAESVRAWPYRDRLVQNAVGMMSPLL